MAQGHLRAGGDVAAVFGFILAASIWWLYFDFSAASPLGRGPLAPQTYAYGHLIIVGGITATGVGTLLAIRAHGATLTPGARWALCGGTAAFLSATSAIQLVNARRPGDPRIWARLTAASLLAALAGAGASISAHALTISVAGLVIAAILAEAVLAGTEQAAPGGLAQHSRPGPSGALDPKAKSKA